MQIQTLLRQAACCIVFSANYSLVFEFRLIQILFQAA